jgi:hypothetical protein
VAVAVRSGDSRAGPRLVDLPRRRDRLLEIRLLDVHEGDGDLLVRLDEEYEILRGRGRPPLGRGEGGAGRRLHGTGGVERRRDGVGGASGALDGPGATLATGAGEGEGAGTGSAPPHAASDAAPRAKASDARQGLGSCLMSMARFLSTGRLGATAPPRRSRLQTQHPCQMANDVHCELRKETNPRPSARRRRWRAPNCVVARRTCEPAAPER